MIFLMAWGIAFGIITSDVIFTRNTMFVSEVYRCADRRGFIVLRKDNTIQCRVNRDEIFDIRRDNE